MQKSYASNNNCKINTKICTPSVELNEKSKSLAY